ncbi:hypothetical protein MKZ38_000275 [Zalerion maritima]|uniref:Heterokaryon incompatibility domain-containing protein n=1 Tax=Zalerion maritima TaxID=339359 RepID=A0AAD5RF57_9PEZI|nr:hypothetical protein MKZ38_000275 [Zalerion maritima]
MSTSARALSPQPQCSYCSVLDFDDSTGFSSANIRSETGEPYLMLDEDDGEKMLSLHSTEYPIEDSFPDLPRLGRSADAGCGFCSMLGDTLKSNDLVSQLAPRGVEAVRILLRLPWRLSRIYGPKGTAMSRLLAQVQVLDPVDSKNYSTRFLCFSLETDSKTCSKWLRMRSSPSQDRLSPENLAWMKGKLNRCKQQHGHTYDVSAPDYTPTRLLDLSGGKVRLVQTVSSTHKYSYVALSYCWGPPDKASQQLTTTKSSLSKRQDGIELAECTEVVRDAIETTTALSIPYLWIDALCIIQDSPEDWNFEASKMGDVYANAELTVCSLASSNCRQGFLSKTRKTAKVAFRSRIMPEIRGDIYIRYNGISTSRRGPFQDYQPLEDQEQSEWILRGWTYQEKALSTRKLWFGSSRIHFLCDSVVHSEGMEPRVPGWDSSVQKDVSHRSRNKVYRDWETHAMLLSRRSFTRYTDTLPALSGIAATFARALPGDSYHAGLWKGNMEAQLLWYLSNQDGLPSAIEALRFRHSNLDPYIAPSWSWAGHYGPVNYTLDDALGRQISGIWSGRGDFRPEHAGIETRLTLKGSNPYGELVDGHIMLQGHVCPVPSAMYPSPVSSPPGAVSKKQLRINGHEYLADCLLDWHPQPATDTHPQGDLVMVLLRSACFKRETLYRRGKLRCSRHEDSEGDLDSGTGPKPFPAGNIGRKRSVSQLEGDDDDAPPPPSPVDGISDLEIEWRDHVKPYKGQKRARLPSTTLMDIRSDALEPKHGTALTSAIDSDDRSDDGQRSRSNEQDHGAEDDEDEDERAGLTTESEGEAEESYDEDELDDVPSEGERICLCKICEAEWKDSDDMRVAYGLLLCPANDLKTTGSGKNEFFRAGVFVSLPAIGRGGLGYFKRFPLETIIIL